MQQCFFFFCIGTRTCTFRTPNVFDFLPFFIFIQKTTTVITVTQTFVCVCLFDAILSQFVIYTIFYGIEKKSLSDATFSLLLLNFSFSVMHIRCSVRGY